MKRSSALLAAIVLLCAFKCESNRTPAAAPAPQRQQQADSGAKVTFRDGFVVKVEIAADDEMRAQGLMFRDHLDEDRGMIFVFAADDEYAFWMKNTIIPLDMIWIDAGRRVMHVAHGVPPCQADPCPSYPPGVKARYVLEVASGVAAKHQVTDGDVLLFEGLDHVTPR